MGEIAVPEDLSVATISSVLAELQGVANGGSVTIDFSGMKFFDNFAGLLLAHVVGRDIEHRRLKVAVKDIDKKGWYVGFSGFKRAMEEHSGAADHLAWTGFRRDPW